MEENESEFDELADILSKISYLSEGPDDVAGPRAVKLNLGGAGKTTTVVLIDGVINNSALSGAGSTEMELAKDLLWDSSGIPTLLCRFISDYSNLMKAGIIEDFGVDLRKSPNSPKYKLQLLKYGKSETKTGKKNQFHPMMISPLLNWHAGVDSAASTTVSDAILHFDTDPLLKNIPGTNQIYPQTIHSVTASPPANPAAPSQAGSSQPAGRSSLDHEITSELLGNIVQALRKANATLESLNQLLNSTAEVRQTDG